MAFQEICISYLEAKTPGCAAGQRLLSLAPVGDVMKKTQSVDSVRLDNVMMRQEFPRHAKL